MPLSTSHHGQTVLITGGTRGIGLACGLAFGQRGARALLTHRWGSACEDTVRAAFAEVGAPAPLIMEADVSQADDTTALMAAIKREHDGVDVFISNVCVVPRGEGVMQHRRRSMTRSLAYSSRPLATYMQAIHDTFGRYPAYALAMSSDGPDHAYPGYDYVAISKAAVECLVRRMALELADHGVHVNALRSRQVLTDSYRDVFGAAGAFLADRFPELSIPPEEVAGAAFALCSGLMDGINGQVVTMDRGARWVDNLITLGPRLEGMADSW